MYRWSHSRPFRTTCLMTPILLFIYTGGNIQIYNIYFLHLVNDYVILYYYTDIMYSVCILHWTCIQFPQTSSLYTWRVALDLSWSTDPVSSVCTSYILPAIIGLSAILPLCMHVLLWTSLWEKSNSGSPQDIHSQRAWSHHLSQWPVAQMALGSS